MAAFRSLTADRQPLEDFKSGASKLRSPTSKDAKSGDSSSTLPLHLFEWSQSSQDGVEIENIDCVSKLEARDPATVRVM